MKRTIVVLCAALSLLLGACIQESNKGASREAKATEQLLNQASTAVGMPAIQNFNEKRMLKMLYELRDTANVVTYTYYLDWQGKRHRICPATSIGYGIPFSAQFTAPQRPDYSSYQDNAVIMQPEPNGLYMPDSTSATWVMCLDPKTKDPKAVYVEPQILVSPFEMTTVD